MVSGETSAATHYSVAHATSHQIIKARAAKNTVDPWMPYHFHVEPEYSASGHVDDVATVFLTNRECPYKCLMCDLWKNTTDTSVPVGAVPAQIDFALKRLSPAPHIKLYNSGNFFDPGAIPVADWPAIADRVGSFRTVIVENHPKLCGADCVKFQTLLNDRAGSDTQLEVALGLETSHEATLATLNKNMTTRDFADACEFLLRHQIQIRAFVLLRPPGVSELDGIMQAIASVRFAFDCGVGCVAVIPTRAGNGIVDEMQQAGTFQPPSLRSLERVIDETVSWNRGRVFADLWEIEQFAGCRECAKQRIERLQQINLSQSILPAIDCCDC
jgi:archaeosine synthase beta-subunit